MWDVAVYPAPHMCPKSISLIDIRRQRDVKGAEEVMAGTPGFRAATSPV